MKIAIIDLDSVMFYIGHPNKKLDENNEPVKENGKFVYIDKTEDELKNSTHYWMNEILTKSEATHYIAYVKGKGNYRYEFKEDYKANRPKESPKWWAFVKDYLIQEFGAVPVNGIEVDDAVNITRLMVGDSFICAIDKDLLCLEGCHYNWSKNEWVNSTKNDAYLKFWTDMIAGQSGDGIKGLAGKGVKFVEKRFSDNTIGPIGVLQCYIEHYNDENEAIEEFYANYKCLKILDKHEGFEIPEPTSVTKEERMI